MYKVKRPVVKWSSTILRKNGFHISCETGRAWLCSECHTRFEVFGYQINDLPHAPHCPRCGYAGVEELVPKVRIDGQRKRAAFEKEQQEILEATKPHVCSCGERFRSAAGLSLHKKDACKRRKAS